MAMIDLTALRQDYAAANAARRATLVKFRGYIEAGRSVPQADIDEYYERCTRVQAIVAAIKQAEQTIEHMEIAKEH